MNVISKRTIVLVPVLCAAALLTACATNNPARSADTTPPPVMDTTLDASARSSGRMRSVEGRAIPVHIRGSGSEVVLLMASIHGDEAAGTPLLERLIEHLDADPRRMAGRTVVIMTETNPDGVATGSRTNVNGVDLNRNFPADNHRNGHNGGPEALSEPEARMIHDVLHRWSPDRIVSLHEPLNCLDYDGPAADLAEAMAAACPLPVRRLGARPGSLGSYAGVDLGIPIITMELPRVAANWSADRLWDTYGEALLVAIDGAG